MANLEQIGNSVIMGDKDEVKKLVKDSVQVDGKPTEIINKGLIRGMDIVGQRFKKGDMYVPEVLLAARAMKEGMDIVKPLIVEDEMESPGKVMLGTVEGDLHDIGKNLVGMLLESAGLEIVNLGIDISAEDFAEKVKEYKPDVLGLSALLTTTMLEIKNTIEVLEEQGLLSNTKIIVGGAPVTQNFADEVGADGWAPDAASAKDLVLDLIRKQN